MENLPISSGHSIFPPTTNSPFDENYLWKRCKVSQLVSPNVSIDLFCATALQCQGQISDCFCFCVHKNPMIMAAETEASNSCQIKAAGAIVTRVSCPFCHTLSFVTCPSCCFCCVLYRTRQQQRPGGPLPTAGTPASCPAAVY